PTEDVRITAAPAAISEQERLAGGKNLRLSIVGSGSPPADAVTLLFTRSNWFVPQFVPVIAPDDQLAPRTRFIDLVHSVTQGSSRNDGGAYDALAIPSVLVEVVDDESASVVVTPYSTGSHAPENGLLVAENPCLDQGAATCDPGSLPATDAYAVVLSKQPTGDVVYQASTDGLPHLSLHGTTWATSVLLTFTTTSWHT